MAGFLGRRNAALCLREPLRCGLLVGLGAWALTAAGCAGDGAVRIMPLMRTDFPEREPLVQEVVIDEAYYWLEDDELNVSLRTHRGAGLGQPFDFEWQLSLVLDEMPAGSSRLYRLDMDSVRMSQTVGADHRRSRSWTGVAVIEAPERGRLGGRFHVNVRQQQFTLLGGWQPHFLQAPMLIVAGRFQATEDVERGQAIRDETEAMGFERGTVATAPAGPDTPHVIH